MDNKNTPTKSTANTPTVFLFSGQGSQYRGMGKSLYAEQPIFRNALDRYDTLIEKHLGRSLIEALYHHPKKIFDDVLMSHPAIVAIELALLELLAHFEIYPDIVVGNSLGEFAATVAAGAYEAEAAVEMAVEQAKAICQCASSGGMLTVINLEQKEVDFSDFPEVFRIAENFPDHFTLSGTEEQLDLVEKQLGERKIPCVRLPIKYAFHTAFIDDAENTFAYASAMMPTLTTPQKRYLSSRSTAYQLGADQNHFWNAVRSPMNFPKVVEQLEQTGQYHYIDLGPSGTSSTFVKYNLPPTSGSKVFQLLNPFGTGAANFKALLQDLG